MTAKWGSCIALAICLALLVGCRSSQPDLKPKVAAQKLVEPPQDARYDSPGYPKQAYDKMVDPVRNAFESKNTPGVMPTRGSMAPGMGGGYR
jgi:hypothetical protein